MIFAVSESRRALAAITSALSYPAQPASPDVQRRTISLSFAVAVSFKRSTVLRSGGGNAVSPLDCRDTWDWLAKSRLVVWNLLAPIGHPILNYLLALVRNTREGNCRIAQCFCKIAEKTRQGTCQPQLPRPLPPCIGLRQAARVSNSGFSIATCNIYRMRLTFHA